MRIDSHQHFWSYNPQRESWITDDMGFIRKDFFPEDLKTILSQNKFDGCIAVEANDSEEESRFLLDLASQHIFIKGVVGWVDLTADDCEDRLAYFAENPIFKGIRHTLQKEDTDFIQNSAFKRGISLLDKFNFSYDLLVLEHQLPAAIELVKEFPAQRFVLDHMGKPQISRGLSHQWIENMQELGLCNNAYCKVSGFLTETERFQWSYNDFYPFLEVAADAFGEDRLMFGSDWPVCLAAGKYEDTTTIVESFYNSRSEIDLEKVMGKTAASFYRI